MCIDTNYNICILSLGLLNFLHRHLTENLCYLAILELKGEIQNYGYVEINSHRINEEF